MNPKRPRNKCLYCGEVCERYKSVFCNNEHQFAFQQREYEERYLSDLESGSTDKNRLSQYARNYILERDRHSCVECGWDKINPVTGKSPLEVHHIDGDYRNNRPENLKTLCPNCHSLTETYRNLNIGHGRDFRYT